MARRRGRRLLAGAVLLALLGAGFAAGQTTGRSTGAAELVGRFAWSEPWEGFGGFSGLEVTRDGTGFTAITDRNLAVSGRLVRDAAGAVEAVEAEPLGPILLRRDGSPARPGTADSEGLAIAADGTVFVSFEGRARVERVSPPAGPLPRHPAFRALAPNGALEALTVTADGTLLTIPERAYGDDTFPVYRLRPGAERWEIAFRLAGRGRFDVVGADMGPDGRLYVLQRAFLGLGFRSRVLRVGLDGEGPEVLLETARGVHDNLEGIAAWRDEAGALRLTLISDDNFSPLQRTEIVDYRLPD